ncbi:hypothetical protein [Luteimonas sp. A611]
MGPQSARLAAVVARTSLFFMARFPARTVTVARQFVGACIELARRSVVVVMAAAPGTCTMVAPGGKRVLVGRIACVAGLGFPSRRGPVVASRIGAPSLEPAARPVELFPAIMTRRMIVALLPSRCGMQPLATLLEVLRAGFKQAFGNRPELADAGDIVFVVGAMTPT